MVAPEGVNKVRNEKLFNTFVTGKSIVSKQIDQRPQQTKVNKVEVSEAKQHSGPVHVQGNQLEEVLGLCWPDTLEAARAGFEGVPLEELPPLSRQQSELAMEALKILFNITFDKGRRSVDEVEKTLDSNLTIRAFCGFLCFYST